MTAFASMLLMALALDLGFGDPRRLPHPVSAIGRWARTQEKLWRGWTRLPLRVAGAGAWFAVVGATVLFVLATLRLTPWMAVYWIYSFLALRSLDQHAMAVVRPLRAGDLTGAREAVAMMVGRDTHSLDESGATRALIETVAENASDGVIAPLFWLGLGGPAAMAGYKAINTLDSMFGYRNERYREFGWWSARADDWANWIPARITALLFGIVAALTPGLDARASLRVTLRDAHRQPSPNSGYPEAAAAGALGVRLGGENFYGGVASRKEFLGDARVPLSWRTYSAMRSILYGASLLFAAILIGVRAWS